LQEADLKSMMEAYEQKFIKHILDNCNGNVSAAANKLGIHRSVLYKKMKKG
jgi:transcriptional regulator with PAS, ATPase and Fis domain